MHQDNAASSTSISGDWPPFSLAPLRPVDLDDLVRLGAAHDGGYVISARCLRATSLLVSFGISDDWSFERAFLEHNPSARLVGVDGSVSASIFARTAARELRTALGAALRGKRSEALAGAGRARRGLSLSRDFAGFFRGRTRAFVNKFVVSETESGSPSSTTWRRLRRECRVETAASSSPLGFFLKMDIEGAEYAVLPEMIADLSAANGIAIECHDCGSKWGRLTELLARLSADFVVAHVHGNNWAGLIPGTTTPQVLEISLINRRMVADVIGPSTARYPRVGLDAPNREGRPDFTLDFCTRPRENGPPKSGASRPGVPY
jgi:hypothetical protein